MKKFVSLLHEEDGAAEMMQVIILLGLAAMMVVFLLYVRNDRVAPWGKEHVSNVLLDEYPEHDGTIVIDPGDWWKNDDDKDKKKTLTLRLTEVDYDGKAIGNPKNTRKDTTNDDATPKTPEDTIVVYARVSEVNSSLEAFLEMKLDGIESDTGKNYSWKIEGKDVSEWTPQSGTFATGNTKKLHWKKASEGNERDYAIRITDSASKAKRMLKVKVEVMKDVKLNLCEISFEKGPDGPDTNPDKVQKIERGFDIRQDNWEPIECPQWKKTPAEVESNPIGYARNTDTRNTVIVVAAKFRIDNLADLDDNTELWIKGDFINLENRRAFMQRAIIKGGIVTIDDVYCGPVGDKVDYRIMKIKWDYQLRKPGSNASDNWQPCEPPVTEHELFVTLDKPSDKMFNARSVFYLACKNTGATDEKTALEKTWMSFKNRDVKIWDDEKGEYERVMHYYKTKGGENRCWAKQMFDSPKNDEGEGQCNAWSDLLRQALGAHGIESNTIMVVHPSQNYFEEEYNYGFVVKHVLISNDGNIDSLEGTPATTGIPGQNMETPKSKDFDRHFFVEVSEKGIGTTRHFYDPSYGVYHTTIKDYTEGAIGAWREKIAVTGKWNYQKRQPRDSSSLKDVLTGWPLDKFKKEKP